MPIPLALICLHRSNKYICIIYMCLFVAAAYYTIVKANTLKLYEQLGPLRKRPLRLVRANTANRRTLAGYLLQRNQYLDFLHYRTYCFLYNVGGNYLAVEEDKAAKAQTTVETPCWRLL